MPKLSGKVSGVRKGVCTSQTKLTVLSSDETVLEGVTARTAGNDSTTGHCDWF